MKRYPAYKDSGIELLGKIPEHWSIKRAKYIFEEINKRTEEGTETLLSVSEYYGVSPRKTVMEEGDWLTRADSLIGYKKCMKNDLVINIMLAWKRGLGITDWDGIVSPSYAVFRCNNHSNPRYFNYLLRTDLYIAEFKRNSTGIIDSRLRLYPDEFLRINLILLSPAEQKFIANYLDRKTQQIDTLIEKKQKQIELLKELRTAIINQAVTKGLNPDVKMKDFGIEWIGEIPSHWEVKRVTTFGTFKKGCGIRKDEIKTSGFSCIRYGEIYTIYDRIIYKTASFIDEESSKKSELVKKGAVLFTGSGETIDEIGKTVVYYGGDDIFVGGDVIILKLKDNLNPLFISYLMNSNHVNHQKSRMGKGEIVVHIYSKQLKDIKTALPPISEQHQIVEYLDEQTQKIDSTIEKETKRIEFLKEYRQSLISEAVTGKIDVRNAV